MPTANYTDEQKREIEERWGSGNAFGLYENSPFDGVEVISKEEYANKGYQDGQPSSTTSAQGNNVGFDEDYWAAQRARGDEAGRASTGSNQALTPRDQKAQAAWTGATDDMKRLNAENEVYQSTWRGGQGIDTQKLYDDREALTRYYRKYYNMDIPGMADVEGYYTNPVMQQLYAMGRGEQTGEFNRDDGTHVPGGAYPGTGNPGGGGYPGGGGNNPGGGGNPPGGGGQPPGGGGQPPGGGGQQPGGDGQQPGGDGLMNGDWENFFNMADEWWQRAQDYGPDEYNIEAPETEVHTREVQDNELSSYQLEQMLDPNSPLAKRAQQEGKDFAASRGLMNSSIAGGNAYGAWIDRAQPFALQDAATYGATASENMGARNAGSMQDSSNEMQARLAETGYNAQRDAAMRDYLLGTSTDLNRAGLNVEAREDQQRYGTSEREATQGWQSGENALDREMQFDLTELQLESQMAIQAAQQAWQSAENSLQRQAATAEAAAARDWQTNMQMAEWGWQSSENTAQRNWSAEQQAAINAFTQGERIDTQAWSAQQQDAANEFQWQRDLLSYDLSMQGINAQDRNIWLQAWTNVQNGTSQSIGQSAAMIYANTDMTPAQQQAAIQNMINFFAGTQPNVPPPPPGLTYDENGALIWDFGG